ncbi:hypothetical protein SY27_16255 [Flavobacterium sp. 316]|uniref:DUF6266 family protein n=1 Tax=Flavobacterium sp. 316 TaxID=1603293 RepID=UPI0005E5ACB5|nr:DUF6266 family protein [Flavobacterium sp. 316]KIX20065.1 hypothetical protein SY27_16255 [Flavobacterium sp. 316]
MGTYNKGILGAFSGKVGPVVGANWRGKEVLRSLPRKSNKAATPEQALHRLKFSTVIGFLGPIYPILSRYYGANQGEKSRVNRAMSYHMKEVAVYADPDFTFAYNKVQLAKGYLTGVEAGTISATTANTIDFSWNDNSGQGEALTTDKLVVGVYDPATKNWIYSLGVAERSITSGTLLLPITLSGATVEVWALFASANEKRNSTSTYLGTITIV